VSVSAGAGLGWTGGQNEMDIRYNMVKHHQVQILQPSADDIGLWANQILR
jgi:hypothetical protein